MSWSSRKRNECIFDTFIFSEGSFWSVCILSRCTVYWINFQNIYTLKSSNAFSLSLSCLFRIFQDSQDKSNLIVFVNMPLVFLLSVYANHRMSCLSLLIWSNRVGANRYLTIWLETTVQSSAMDFWTTPFSNWL